MSKEPYAVLALNAIEPTRRHLKVTDFGSMVTVADDASTRRADPESTAKEGWANNFAVFRSPRYSKRHASAEPDTAGIQWSRVRAPQGHSILHS